LDHCIYTQASRLGIAGNAVKTEVLLNFHCSRRQKVKEECERSIKNTRVYVLAI